MYLKRIELLRDEIASYNKYPFTIPTIRNLHQIEITNPITFFVGENGTGKSTLLEAIADKCGFNTAGGGRNHLYEVHASESVLSNFVRLSWLPKISKGFFLRAESFYHFASHIDNIATEHSSIYDAYGGTSLHEQSHGESFLSLFTNHFQGKSIYLLDEPEAALSPQRQLAFLKIIHDLVTTENCQFIITTHSPILLGYPGATIYSFDDEEIHEVDYETTNHYQITKYFLQNREKFIKDLFEDD